MPATTRSHPPSPPLTPHDPGRRPRRERDRLGEPAPAARRRRCDEADVGVGEVRPRHQREVGGAGDDDRRDRGVGGLGWSGPAVHTPTATVRDRDVAGPPQAGTAELHRPRRVVTDRHQVGRARSQPAGGRVEVQRRQATRPRPPRPRPQDHEHALGPGRQPAGRVAEHHPRDERRAQPGDHQARCEQQRRADRRGCPTHRRTTPARRRRAARREHATVRGAVDESAAAATSAQPAPTRRNHADPRSSSERVRGGVRGNRPRGEPDDEPDHAEHEPARHRTIVAQHAADSMGADPCRRSGVLPSQWQAG